MITTKETTIATTVQMSAAVGLSHPTRTTCSTYRSAIHALMRTGNRTAKNRSCCPHSSPTIAIDEIVTLTIVTRIATRWASWTRSRTRAPRATRTTARMKPNTARPRTKPVARNASAMITEANIPRVLTPTMLRIEAMTTAAIATWKKMRTR